MRLDFVLRVSVHAKETAPPRGRLRRADPRRGGGQGRWPSGPPAVTLG